MNKPLIVFGCGGHASVLIDILLQQKRDVIGCVCPEMNTTRRVFDHIPHYFSDDEVLNFSPNSIKLVNGIGSLPKNKLRAAIYDKFTALKYEFETVVAPSAIVSTYAFLANGSQILSNVIIQVGTKVGENTLVNSGAIVEHDCCIGKNNHLAPGVTISGGVSTHENVHIGTGASVIQSIVIEGNSVIGAGAVITKNVMADSVVYPARSVQKV